MIRRYMDIGNIRTENVYMPVTKMYNGPHNYGNIFTYNRIGQSEDYTGKLSVDDFKLIYASDGIDHKLTVGLNGSQGSNIISLWLTEYDPAVTLTQDIFIYELSYNESKLLFCLGSQRNFFRMKLMDLGFKFMSSNPDTIDFCIE